MTEITREEFLDWKSQNVTKAVMREVENIISGLEHELGYLAGVDPMNDRTKVGAIQAWRDFLDLRIGND